MRLGPQCSHDVLDAAFSELSLGDGAPVIESPQDVAQEEQAALERISAAEPDSSGRSSVVLMAMRKFREGIVAAGRVDAFFLQAYSFIIRFTILARHPESYHPALLYLLSRTHQARSLPKGQTDEFVSYYVLDLACRQADLATAYQIKQKYHLENPKIELVLQALVRGNWILFWKMQDRLDMYQQRLVESSENNIRGHAIKCIGQSYLSVEQSYIEKITKSPWERLRKETGVAWVLEEGSVVIKRIKRK